jgi:uroporphyrinogen-III synthase
MDNLAALLGLRVLVTRPAHQAVSLISALNQASATPLLLPVTTIIPTINDPSVGAALQQYEQANSIIFTSSNAVRNAILAINKANKSWPPVQSVFAIGPATCHSLNVSNCNNVIMPDIDFSSEGLLAKSELQHIKDNIIIIFGGANPRPLLATQLQQRGAHVLHAACYMRQPLTAQMDIKQQAELLNKVDIIVCTSNETLLNLIQAFDKGLHNQLFDKEFLVINSHMKTTLKGLGYIKSPIIADNPTDHSIMSALTLWYEEHHHD